MSRTVCTMHQAKSAAHVTEMKENETICHYPSHRLVKNKILRLSLALIFAAMGVGNLNLPLWMLNVGVPSLLKYWTLLHSLRYLTSYSSSELSNSTATGLLDM